MSARFVTAQVTEAGPLYNADLQIWWDPDDHSTLAIDVRLDAIGRHPARWVPVQLVQQYLDATPDTGDAA